MQGIKKLKMELKGINWMPVQLIQFFGWKFLKILPGGYREALSR